MMLFATIACLCLPTVEQWGIFEVAFKGPPDDGSPSAFLVSLTAIFELQDQTQSSIVVTGFFDGGDVFKIRFSPPTVGRWEYVTMSSETLLNGTTGGVNVIEPSNGQHGPVKSHGFGLVHADGTPHFSVGTTSYQWASQPRDRQELTLKTLRAGYFNKMRMTVFPKVLNCISCSMWSRSHH